MSKETLEDLLDWAALIIRDELMWDSQALSWIAAYEELLKEWNKQVPSE